MLPEDPEDGAGAASGTKPISPAYANRGLLAVAPLGTSLQDTAAWVIIYEEPPGWAGPGFTRRNDESAPPTLEPASQPPKGDDQ